jgi:hypothetical protein
MESSVKNILRSLSGLMVVLAMVAGAAAIAIAQQPTPTPKKSDAKTEAPKAEAPAAQAGEDAGNYTITSSIEFGYRGQRVGGDVNKFKSDLNYKAGPRLFDSSFLMRSKDGKSGLFDTLLVTGTGWGADPQGNLRISVEKSKWFRFDGQYRRFKYYRFLNNIANPNWLFSPANFAVSPNPVTGLHGFNTNSKLGDFNLTILPKNEKIRFNLGYSPERYSGPFLTDYHMGGNDFSLLANAKSRANDFRLGADGRLGPVDFSFLQGFRRFREDSSIDFGKGVNVNPAVAQLTSFNRQEPTRGSVNYTQFSVHSLVARKLDMTARIVHSNSTSNSAFLENLSALNWSTRITGYPPTPPAATPNILNLGQYNILANTTRPDTLFDFGVTFLATSKFRVSNTFRVEDFKINGVAVFNDFFSTSRPNPNPTRTDTIAFNNLAENTTVKYRKYSDTIEADFQFNPRYSVHFGYRYGSRRDEQIRTGFDLTSNGPIPLTTGCPVITAHCAKDEVETNHTNAFFAGFKAHPVKNWTLYFDAEHGAADNVFTRIGNYNYTNIRAKTRYTVNRQLSFNFGVITRNNANPSEIAGVSLNDFGVDTRLRTFTSSLDWTPTPRFTLNTGYNYNWVNSDAVVDYFYQVPPAAAVQHPIGHSLYFSRNNFFFVDTTTQLLPRVTLFAAYRVNQDDGQGSRVADPTGTPGTLISSYPMSFQSPEFRFAIKLNNRLDWNLGYQYYNYNENAVVGPRPQNYHAHLPYTSLRLYFGRKE